MNVIKLLRQVQGDKVTLIQAADMFRGSQLKRFLERGYQHLEGFGEGKNLSRDDAHRLLQHMVLLDILHESATYNAKGFSNSVIHVRLAVFRG